MTPAYLHMILRMAAALAVTVALTLPPASRAQDAGPPGPLPVLSISIAPGGSGPTGEPAWVDVTTRISGVEWRAGQPFLRIPVKFAGVAAIAYTPETLQAQDQDGSIALVEAVDDPDAGGFLYFRRWSPARDTGRDVTLHYRAPIGLTIPRLGSGPPFDLRAAGGGFSAAGNNFLVVPDIAQPMQIEIRWQLDALRDGAIGVSSFGEGTASFAGVSDQLTATYFMAGPLGRYPDGDRSSGFSGYWIGSPHFDARSLLEWSEQAYRAVAGFFGDADPPAFRVLMRGNPYEGGGGAALINSFLVSYPDSREDGTALRETIAHETVHNWVTSIAGPPGTTSWFSEGMTVAYTRRILLLSGLFTPDEFLDSVNESATSYYTNALNRLPNDEIARNFWSDTRVRTLPYTRGSLYFAAVDSAVRKRSGGKRSLDDLLRAFLDTRKTGEEPSMDTWRTLVAAELGDSGVASLDAMLAGDLVAPPSDAFGPCFAREAVELRRFDLGFDRASLVVEPRIVTGLEAGSQAARAGLRDGDRILRPVALEAVQSQPDRRLRLQVQRGDTRLDIEYLPRGETVPGYRWVRAAGSPDTACAPD